MFLFYVSYIFVVAIAYSVARMRANMIYMKLLPIYITIYKGKLYRGHINSFQCLDYVIIYLLFIHKHYAINSILLTQQYFSFLSSYCQLTNRTVFLHAGINQDLLDMSLVPGEAPEPKSVYNTQLVDKMLEIITLSCQYSELHPGVYYYSCSVIL